MLTYRAVELQHRNRFQPPVGTSCSRDWFRVCFKGYREWQDEYRMVFPSLLASLFKHVACMHGITSCRFTMAHLHKARRCFWIQRYTSTSALGSILTALTATVIAMSLIEHRRASAAMPNSSCARDEAANCSALFIRECASQSMLGEAIALSLLSWAVRDS